MTASPAPADDAAMTAAREEHKFLLPRDEAQALLQRLDAELQRHRFQGPGANALPGAHHYTTTLYFDTAAHHLLRQAARFPHDNLKLRAREYYDRHPDLLETATDASQLDVCQPRLWLELKSKQGSHTSKQRVGVPKAQALAFLAGQALDDPGQAGGALQVERGVQASDEVLRQWRAVLAQQAEPFEVSCALHYRRLAWQDASSSVRVTLDVDLAVFAGHPQLLAENRPLVREALGEPVYSTREVIAEVKLRRAPDGWLSDWLVAHAGRAMPGGKFLIAGRWLYPGVAAAVDGGAVPGSGLR